MQQIPSHVLNNTATEVNSSILGSERMVQWKSFLSYLYEDSTKIKHLEIFFRMLVIMLEEILYLWQLN
jgi:hypothetical protein